MSQRREVSDPVVDEEARRPIDAEPVGTMRPPGVPAGVFQRKLAQRRAARDQAPAANDAGRLPAPVQDRMESSFGADFSAVRIHEGAAATEVGARAFAQGTDLHFAPGEYDPASVSGQELIGHELAHVVQQRDGRVSAAQGKGGNIATDAGLEAEADRAGEQAARGGAVDMTVGDQSVTGSCVQRKDEHRTRAGASKELSTRIANRPTVIIPRDLTTSVGLVDTWFATSLSMLAEGDRGGGPDLEAHRLLAAVAEASKALFRRGADEPITEAEDELVHLQEDTDRSEGKAKESNLKVKNLTVDLGEQRGLHAMITKGRIKKHQARKQRSMEKYGERRDRLEPVRNLYDQGITAKVEAWPEAQALAAAHEALSEYVRSTGDSTGAFTDNIGRAFIGDVTLGLKDSRIFNQRERILLRNRQEQYRKEDEHDEEGEGD